VSSFVGVYEAITGIMYVTPSTTTVARGVPAAVITPSGLNGVTGPVTDGEPFTHCTRTAIPASGGLNPRHGIVTVAVPMFTTANRPSIRTKMAVSAFTEPC
jgi:hypothetical protein